jgi:tetratricopeptide (TPR) repeat protein
MTHLLRKNWPIAKLNQITLYTEFSCCITLLGWFLFLALFPTLRGLPALLLAVGLYLSIFLHELGHVLVARHYKMEAPSITLHGLGGSSKILSRYKQALQLLEVSLAGSLANLSLFLGLSLLLRVWKQGELPLVFEQLRWANLLLGLGALLPIVPLDGNHVAQAIHWQVTGKPSAKLPWMRSEIGNGLGLVSLCLGLYCCSQSLVGVGMGLITLGFWMGSGHSTQKAAVQFQDLSSGTSPRQKSRTTHKSQKRSSPKHRSISKGIDVPAPSPAESPYLETHCLTKDNANPIFQKGLLYAEDLDFTEMIKAFSEALNQDPNCAIAYHNRGYAYFQTDEHQKALADFQDALRLAPNCAESYLARGITAAALQDLPGAIMDFDSAIKLDAHHARAFFNRACAYLQFGNHTAAVSDFQTAATLFSGQSDSTMLRQVAYQLKSLNVDIQDIDVTSVETSKVGANDHSC